MPPLFGGMMPAHAEPSAAPDGRVKRNLAVAALGVVYGDIGTSPLYTIRQCFDGVGSISAPRVFGVLSLIVWALTIVVTLKYVLVLMRADNRGAGAGSCLPGWSAARCSSATGC